MSLHAAHTSRYGPAQRLLPGIKHLRVLSGLGLKLGNVCQSPAAGQVHRVGFYTEEDNPGSSYVKTIMFKQDFPVTKC